MAKRYGFQIRLLYVLLKDVEPNIERVKLRVLKGGHGVPEQKIRERWIRSFEQLPWFLAEADFALIYDNSGAKPKLIGHKQDGVLEIDPSAPLALKTAVNKLRK
jgi:predicted ABC-type ATPase